MTWITAGWGERLTWSSFAENPRHAEELAAIITTKMKLDRANKLLATAGRLIEDKNTDTNLIRNLKILSRDLRTALADPARAEDVDTYCDLIKGLCPAPAAPVSANAASADQQAAGGFLPTVSNLLGAAQAQNLAGQKQNPNPLAQNPAGHSDAALRAPMSLTDSSSPPPSSGSLFSAVSAVSASPATSATPAPMSVEASPIVPSSTQTIVPRPAPLPVLTAPTPPTSPPAPLGKLSPAAQRSTEPAPMQPTTAELFARLHSWGIKGSAAGVKAATDQLAKKGIQALRAKLRKRERKLTTLQATPTTAADYRERLDFGLWQVSLLRDKIDEVQNAQTPESVAASEPAQTNVVPTSSKHSRGPKRPQAALRLPKRPPIRATTTITDGSEAEQQATGLSESDFLPDDSASESESDEDKSPVASPLPSPLPGTVRPSAPPSQPQAAKRKLVTLDLTKSSEEHDDHANHSQPSPDGDQNPHPKRAAVEGETGRAVARPARVDFNERKLNSRQRKAYREFCSEVKDQVSAASGQERVRLLTEILTAKQTLVRTNLERAMLIFLNNEIADAKRESEPNAAAASERTNSSLAVPNTVTTSSQIHSNSTVTASSPAPSQSVTSSVAGTNGAPRALDAFPALDNEPLSEGADITSDPSVADEEMQEILHGTSQTAAANAVAKRHQVAASSHSVENDAGTTEEEDPPQKRPTLQVPKPTAPRPTAVKSVGVPRSSGTAPTSSHRAASPSARAAKLRIRVRSSSGATKAMDTLRNSQQVAEIFDIPDGKVAYERYRQTLSGIHDREEIIRFKKKSEDILKSKTSEFTTEWNTARDIWLDLEMRSTLATPRPTVAQ